MKPTRMALPEGVVDNAAHPFWKRFQDKLYTREGTLNGVPWTWHVWAGSIVRPTYERYARTPEGAIVYNARHVPQKETVRSQGYPVVSYQSRNYSARRALYEREWGTIDDFAEVVLRKTCPHPDRELCMELACIVLKYPEGVEPQPRHVKTRRAPQVLPRGKEKRLAPRIIVRRKRPEPEPDPNAIDPSWAPWHPKVIAKVRREFELERAVKRLEESREVLPEGVTAGEAAMWHAMGLDTPGAASLTSQDASLEYAGVASGTVFVEFDDE